ncbi:hypothetical protein DPEC_G00152770 [Dallia pectoralis]|uniref:Uncharacterized protein n=1 Tax=Dallia pectoralis TaxID=75939 RepID=A0ACC2GJR6_DALPE|nr:hypothetical protein DPEC_G00152770 [Dallia pectoralis]
MPPELRPNSPGPMHPSFLLVSREPRNSDFKTAVLTCTCKCTESVRVFPLGDQITDLQTTSTRTRNSATNSCRPLHEDTLNSPEHSLPPFLNVSVRLGQNRDNHCVVLQYQGGRPAWRWKKLRFKDSYPEEEVPSRVSCNRELTITKVAAGFSTSLREGFAF